MGEELERDRKTDPELLFGATARSPALDKTSVPPTSREDAPELDWSGVMGSQARRYELTRKLGAGGMGVVYLARDTKLDREVAIKALHETASASDQQRLLYEAKSLAKLSHPNVVQVYDADMVEGRLRIAMEYVPGQDLRAWLAVEPRSLVEILEVFVAAGKGLAAAHKANLTHRDFKPDNVLIGEDGRVRVLDFGLARSNDGSEPLAPASTSDTSMPHDLTLTGQLVGTPAYMPPERFTDAPQTRADARSDQYAFCVSLYEALHGERPFKGRSYAALVHAITQGVIEKPDPSNARVAKVPKSVMAVIRRGLSRDPEQRFASMDEVTAALRRAVRRARRRTTRWLLFGACVTAALAGGVFQGYRYFDARAYERECLVPARTQYATGTRDGLLGAAAHMDNCEVGPKHRSAAAAELLRVDAALLFGAPRRSPGGSTLPMVNADSNAAWVGDALWQIGTDADALELHEYEQLWAQVREQAPLWLDALEIAGSKSTRSSVASDNHLWLMALIVGIEPAGKLESAELRARLDDVIDRSVYSLLFRAQLEPDHRSAAELLARSMAGSENIDESVKELLRGEQAYRLALQAHASGDLELTAAARELLALGESPLGRHHLARVALELTTEAEPLAIRLHLDEALAIAPRLWWDTRYIRALGDLESVVRAAEQNARQRAAQSQQKQDLLDGYLHETIEPGEAIERARRLRDEGDDDWRLTELIGQALVAIAEADPSDENREAAQLEYERLLANPGLPAAKQDEARQKLEALRPRTLRRTVAKLPKHEVTFYKGDHNAAVFKVQGEPEIQAAPSTKRQLPAKRLRMSCRKPGADEWTEEVVIEPKPGMTLRCTKAGVKSDR